MDQEKMTDPNAGISPRGIKCSWLRALKGLLGILTALNCGRKGSGNQARAPMANIKFIKAGTGQRMMKEEGQAYTKHLKTYVDRLCSKT